ncbi:hypothetical protein AOLI_G00259310 [Acnodon oligacanthus]
MLWLRDSSCTSVMLDCLGSAAEPVPYRMQSCGALRPCVYIRALLANNALVFGTFGNLFLWAFPFPSVGAQKEGRSHGSAAEIRTERAPEPPRISPACSPHSPTDRTADRAFILKETNDFFLKELIEPFFTTRES